jgi:two-component system sensor histidine kinase KdpD
MAQRRPDPDELLKTVQRAEEQAERGKLKVFLGSSAGVGKTYAMLSQAHEELNRGVDVVIGYVETHGRKETEALVQGLERLPMKEIEHKGVILKEFDIDLALKRHPQLLLVDELAHTNAPGSRHPKRYLDVEELIRSGIDVYTSINIQHLESLNDIVAQITGVQVRETIPDSVFDFADDVELIDIPAKALIQRLKEGKVYVTEQIDHAIQGFFREGNLTALRELSLRRTADRVDAQMEHYRSEQAIQGLWPARERILVCIAPNKLSSRLVRVARRMSESLHADVLAVYVESDRQSHRSAEDRAAVQQALHLAEELNMEIVMLSGHDIVGEVLHLANKRNVTQIVVGKPIKARWKEILAGSVVDELVRNSGDINIHVITGEKTGEAPAINITRKRSGTPKTYSATVAIVALATALCFVMYQRLSQPNLIMIYLLSSAVISSKFGLEEAVLGSLLSVACFDFFFVQPRFSFSIEQPGYIFTFAVMFGVSMLIGTLAQRMRANADSASRRERRTAALYALSRQLVKSRSKKEISKATAASVLDILEFESVVLLPDDTGHLMPSSWASKGGDRPNFDVAVAEWALKHGEPAGKGTTTLPGSDGLYLPLKGSGDAVGILAVKPKDEDTVELYQMDLLQSLGNQAALALERANLAKESHNIRLQVESERLRNTLLSSVSHDLRTPLTSIAGAASTLLNSAPNPEQQRELATTIYEESDRLNRLVRNLLDMTRLESGELNLNWEWESAEELVGSAVRRTEEVLAKHKLNLNIEKDLPLLKVDGPMIEQVLINLLENAGRHSPEGSKVEVKVSKSGGFVRFEISDNGPGVATGDEEAIFEKFHRGKQAAPAGFGLGLAICRGVLKAHGSQIWARKAPGGGALFVFELKADASPEVNSDK